MRFGPILLITVAFFMASTAGTAQTISGQLLESGSGQPILLGRVVLADSAFQVVQETLTDHNGNFTLQAPALARTGWQPSA
mgnify:CR=1 FL=1